MLKDIDDHSGTIYKNKFITFFLSLQKMIKEKSEIMSIINNFKRLTRTIEFK